MDADLNLNQSANLPDGTAEANSGGTKGSLAGIHSTDFVGPDPKGGTQLDSPNMGPVTQADLERGYTVIDVKATGVFDPDITGENQVGDPFTFGGFLGRPRGNAR